MDPPATEGAFNVRYQEAAAEQSALSALVAPVCADITCQATVETDAAAAVAVAKDEAAAVAAAVAEDKGSSGGQRRSMSGGRRRRR